VITLTGTALFKQHGYHMFL